jgi:hypothetical protein
VAASQELNHAEASLAAKLKRKEIEDRYEEERKARAEDRALKHWGQNLNGEKCRVGFVRFFHMCNIESCMGNAFIPLHWW